jgi:hypothetical protein
LETYVEAKDLVHNPAFVEQRQKALGDLDLSSIDEPIVDLITRFARLPYCFTLQSCYGHFLLDHHSDPHTLEPLPSSLNHETDVEYRIAYLAFCVSDNQPGRSLLRELSELCRIDSKYIQYGCADWFWERQTNSYVLQVEPERHKTKDRCVIEYQEALHIEKARNLFFDQLDVLLKKRA